MLSAKLYEPLLGGTTGIIYDNLLDFQTGGLKMSKAATIGYDTMDIDIIVQEPEMRAWITHGLGRHLEVIAPSGIAWEGFVNEIRLSIGATDLTIGPLMDVRNKIKVAYTTKRWATNPPIGGQAAETSFNSDTDSISRWGTFEEVISGGEGISATMTAMRDSKLNDLAWPKISTSFSSSRGGSGVISLSFLGYYYMLERYLYDSVTTATGLRTATNKIEDVLDDDPDSLFSSANSDIEATTLEVPSVDDGTRRASDVVKELISIGYSSGRRALFTVGANRFVTMKPLATDKNHKYEYNIHDSKPSLLYLSGDDVRPWDIQPGEWVKLSSLSTTAFSSSLPRNSDPRFMFIESVTYNAPTDISIEGGLGNTIQAKLAKSYSVDYANG